MKYEKKKINLEQNRNNVIEFMKKEKTISEKFQQDLDPYTEAWLSLSHEEKEIINKLIERE